MVRLCPKRTSSTVTTDCTSSSKRNCIFNGYTLQIAATVITSLLHIPLVGVNLAYSAVLIAQLEDCQYSEDSCNDIIYITESDSSWIASLLTIFIPVGGIFGGIMLDSLGRLTLLRLSAVPGAIGWILLATATNVPMLIVGRILNGFAASWVISAAFVYISEISKPHIRGSMITIPSTCGALGIALVYTMGYFLHWRIIAWVTVMIILLSALLTSFLPQSAVWLVSKGRIEMARAALESINRYHENPEQETKEQLEVLIKLYCSEEKSSSTVSCINTLKMLLKPAVYKPLLILSIFNYFVQFAGISVVIFYAVSLFKDAGTDIDPFIASIGFGAARLIASIGTIGLMQRYGRRPLMIASGLIMSVTIGISGMYTKWILEGTTTQTWVPLVMMTLYAVATMIGFLGIPIAIPAELFPTKVRGLGQSVAIGILYILAFASTRSYYELKNALGGSPGLQFFFSAMSFGGALYTYIFLPETHKKSLQEIEEYFKTNSIYLLHLIRSREKRSTGKEIDVKV